MSEKPKRPWFRFRLLTVVLLVLLTNVIAWIDSRPHKTDLGPVNPMTMNGVANDDDDWRMATLDYGWPWSYYTSDSGFFRASGYQPFHLTGCLLDVLAGLTMLTFAAVLIESFLRRFEPRFLLSRRFCYWSVPPLLIIAAVSLIFGPPCYDHYQARAIVNKWREHYPFFAVRHQQARDELSPFRRLPQANEDVQALLAMNDVGISAMIELLHDNDKTMQGIGVDVLACFKSKATAAVPELAALLNDKNLREQVFTCLGRMGSVASAAVPTLRRIAGSQDGETYQDFFDKEMAKWALKRISSE